MSATAVTSGLPERASVGWRPRAEDAVIRRREGRWTLSTLAFVVPTAVVALALLLLSPLTAPLAVILLVHAWIVCELYAARGAGVVRPSKGRHDSEGRALRMLGDLVGEDARALHACTGLILERGELGVWLLGETGALLVRPGARRVNCYCVKVAGGELPPSDRIAHLLLALRCDERDFVTVANLAFSGAAWRVHRRLKRDARIALGAARHAAR